jgi:hypothetical protein
VRRAPAGGPYGEGFSKREMAREHAGRRPGVSAGILVSEHASGSRPDRVIARWADSVLWL